MKMMVKSNKNGGCVVFMVVAGGLLVGGDRIFELKN